MADRRCPPELLDLEKRGAQPAGDADEAYFLWRRAEVAQYYQRLGGSRAAEDGGAPDFDPALANYVAATRAWLEEALEEDEAPVSADVLNLLAEEMGYWLSPSCWREETAVGGYDAAPEPDSEVQRVLLEAAEDEASQAEARHAPAILREPLPGVETEEEEAAPRRRLRRNSPRRRPGKTSRRPRQRPPRQKCSTRSPRPGRRGQTKTAPARTPEAPASLPRAATGSGKPPASVKAPRAASSARRTSWPQRPPSHSAASASRAPCALGPRRAGRTSKSRP